MMIIFLGLITLLFLLGTIAIVFAPTPIVARGLIMLYGIFASFLLWAAIALREDPFGVSLFAGLSIWSAASAWITHRVSHW